MRSVANHMACVYKETSTSCCGHVRCACNNGGSYSSSV